MKTRVICLLAVLITGWNIPLQALECKTFQEAIENSLKLIAVSKAESIGDNSAPRATLRALEIANELTLVTANLTLMSNQRCPLPAEPIRTGKYLLNALKCSTERLKGVADSPLCDFAKWAPDEGKKDSEKAN